MTTATAVTTLNRTVYEYLNPDGSLYCEVTRVDRPDGGKEIFTQPPGLDGPHPLYHADRLANLPANKAVFVVEGEKCVEALEAVGLNATTSKGGSNGAAKTDWSSLQRFPKIIVLPDNDDPGRKYAADILNILKGLPGARRVKVIDLPGLPPKGDVYDFLQEHTVDDLLEIVKRAPTCTPGIEIVAESQESQPLEVKNIIRDIPAAEKYPVYALGRLQPVAELIAQQVQVPLATAAQSILAATALAVQQHGNWCIDGRVSPASLFMMTVCGTGDRKSAVDKIALWPHRQWEDNQFIQYEGDMDVFRKERKAYNAAVKSAERKRDREAIGAAIRDIGPEPIEPLHPAFILGNLTAEGLHRQLCEGIPSCGVFTDEGGSLVGGHAMAQENMLRTLSDFSKLWDASSEIRVRADKDKKTTRTKGKRVSMHIMMQPDVAALLFQQRIAHNQGFLPRVLVVWPETLRGTRVYQRGDISDNPHIQDYNDRILQILNTAPEYENERQDTLVPHDLAPSPESYELWVSFYEAIERQNAPGGSLDGIAGWASKAAEHAGRIATVLALYDDIQQMSISSTHMANGITLAEFYMHEMSRVHAQGQHDVEVLDADLMLKWMQNKATQVDNVFTSQFMLQNGPNRLRDTYRIQEVCILLQEMGVIEHIPGKGKKWRLT
jgi:hypothetical protein